MFKLEIELGNSHMQTRADIADALVNIGENVEFSESSRGVIRDANGNTVGFWTIDAARKG